MTVASIRAALEAATTALNELDELQKKITTAEAAYLAAMDESDRDLFRLRAAQIFYEYGDNEYNWRQYITKHLGWGHNGLANYPNTTTEYDEAIILKDDCAQIVYQGPSTQSGPGDAVTVKLPFDLIDGNVTVEAYVAFRAEEVFSKIRNDQSAAEQAAVDAAEAKRKSDLATLARLKATYENQQG